MTNDLNHCFAALSDPTRRALIEQLLAGPASVGQLAQNHTMALPTLMKHLKVLERCGLVHSEKKGRVRICVADLSPLLEVQGWLAWQTHVWDTQNSHADQFSLALPTPNAQN